MLCLKRIESFCASHRLFNPTWSNEKNAEIFGKCAHINGHGHNYKLEVVVCGKMNPQTGMVFNLSVLKEIIKVRIIDYVDHKHLNFDVPWLKDKIPTTEVLVESIWNELEDACRTEHAQLQAITIWETDKNSVTKERGISYVK